MKSGFSIYTYVGNETGLGKIPDYFVQMLKWSKISYQLNRVYDSPSSTFLSDQLNESNDFPINLYFFNASGIRFIKKYFPLAHYQKQYEIGIWFWEYIHFPYMESFDVLDEIWVFSEFIAQLLKKHTNKPIIYIPLPYQTDTTKYLHEGKNPFVVLTIFDFSSCFYRKNPIGVIKAFKYSFGNNENVKLIIKSKNGNRYPDLVKILLKEINDDPRIEFIDKNITKEALNLLLASCHVFMSLHGSEGLGLNILDAISLEKPVIATRYGGNVEFMHSSKMLVDYELKEQGVECKHNHSDALIAFPDIIQAAHYLKNVYEHYGNAIDHAQNLKKEVNKKYSLEKTHQMVLNRMSEINQKFLNEHKFLINKSSDVPLITLSHMLTSYHICNVLMFYTVPLFKMKDILKILSNPSLNLKLSIFGRKCESLMGLVDTYYKYPYDGSYDLRNINKNTLIQMKKRTFDLALIPFFNDNKETFDNVIGIISVLNVKKVLFINGLFQIEEVSQ